MTWRQQGRSGPGLAWEKIRTKPGKMVQLAFALGLSHQELDEYLQKGLRMPGIQVNDYREMIYYYGLEHGLSIQECDQMILVFESICAGRMFRCRKHILLNCGDTMKHGVRRTRCTF